MQTSLRSSTRLLVFLVPTLFVGYVYPLGAQTLGGSIRGLIRGAPPTGVRTAVDVGLAGTEHHAQPDSTGRFIFSNLSQGSYVLVVRTTDRETIRRAVSVTPNQIVEIDLDLNDTPQLAKIVVSESRGSRSVRPLPDVDGTLIFAGMKTTRLVVDSVHVNAAQDISREVLGRIPGATFSETAGSGFPSNGVGFRGLDPTQSIEVNTRQNGVNIAADLYGYPETYYTPPMEAVDHIDVIRGASSLQYGPQFGGAINYVLKDGTPNSPLKLTTQQTAASFGTFNSFNSLGGGSGPWTYYAFLQYRGERGWRPNSDYHQGTGYAKLSYRASDRVTLSADYSGFRNYIQMPGGLSDAQFAADPRASFRARNWLESPWNVTTLSADVRVSDRAALTVTASYMRSARALVWRNEDGGPQTLDVPDSAGQFVPREVQRETFRNFTTEARLRVDHRVLGVPSTLATGIRYFSGSMGRQGGGPGSRSADFDLGLYGGPYGYDMMFGTQNVAAYAENTIHLSDRLSITPGVREEYVVSTARGYTDIGTFPPAAKTRAYPLLGTGAQYDVSDRAQLYANVTQAYRPITYDALTPFGSASVIDPNLHDARGYNADLGLRGSIGHAMTYDVSLFYLRYNDRIGQIPYVTPAGDTTAKVLNVANSVHRGVESYFEIEPFALVGATSRLGTVRLFDALAYVDARYVSGPSNIKGNEVESAPRIVNRAGVSYGIGTFIATIQLSHTAQSFSDATNAATNPGSPGPIGVVPAYHVLDLSASWQLVPKFRLQGGINNLADAHYFTKRTNEYPGPGIIPAIGRSVYFGGGSTVRFGPGN